MPTNTHEKWNPLKGSYYNFFFHIIIIIVIIIIITRVIENLNLWYIKCALCNNKWRFVCVYIHSGAIANMLSVEIPQIKNMMNTRSTQCIWNMNEQYYCVLCIRMVRFIQYKRFRCLVSGSFHCDLTFCNKIISDTDAMTVIETALMIAVANVRIYSGHIGLVMSFVCILWMDTTFGIIRCNSTHVFIKKPVSVLTVSWFHVTQ